jgi:hypothetical protein
MLTRTPLVVLATLAIATAKVHAAPTWQLTTADATSRAGLYGSMRLDSGGEPHMCSWAYTGLRYTWHDLIGWHGETVPTYALESAAAPGRAASGPASLRVADRGRGSQPVHTELLNWLLSSIALDPTGEPHIAWTQTNDTSVMGPTYTAIWYASRGVGGWTAETAGPEVGEGPSLDIDASGQPYIAYSPSAALFQHAAGIHCASKNLGVWTVTTVDSPGSDPSLRIDPNGAPHVAYDGPNGIRYASLSPLGWTSVQVAPSGYSPSLAFNRAGEPRIAYVDLQYHVAYAEPIGGVWVTSIADNTSGGDVQPSLALSPTSEPRISYESQSSFRPWFAERDAGTWTNGVIDPAHDGYYPQTGVDAVGRTFVAYQDNYLQQMRWAEGTHPTTVPLSQAAAGFTLSAVSPIREDGTLRVRLGLDRDESVTLEAFDVSGRRVAARAAERMSAGTHDLTLTITTAHGGFYVVRARDASGRTTSARVIAVR